MDHEQPDFDADYYLQQYPDIAASGVDPYLHFIHFGIAEGRLGAPPRLRRFDGGVPFDPTRETILVVSHEASMTGAPILSLNLIRGLQQTYNVVSMLLGGGPLVPAFREACTASIEPLGRRHHAELASETVDQVAQLYDFKYALVNSIECALVLAPLARVGVPSIVMIHEFAAYSRPHLLFESACRWATEVVFSTRITYEDVIAAVPGLADRTCRFVPQGRCTLLAHELDSESYAREMARIRSALRPDTAAPDTIVVIGIGSVQMRKGVELFVDCAAKVMRSQPAAPMRFVWIGDGLDTDRDVEYSIYLADQVRRAGLAGNLEFMRTTPLVEAVYEYADIFLLTSRLDPLPGVAIEAMSHRLPVVCFEGTTGIAAVMHQYGLGDEAVAPYLDTAAMAEKVLDFVGSAERRAHTGARLEAVAREYFDMQTYVSALDALAGACRDPKA